jgi:hypothetical protein
MDDIVGIGEGGIVFDVDAAGCEVCTRCDYAIAIAKGTFDRGDAGTAVHAGNREIDSLAGRGNGGNGRRVGRISD